MPCAAGAPCTLNGIPARIISKLPISRLGGWSIPPPTIHGVYATATVRAPILAGATHEKLWVEPDRLLLTSKQSSTLRTYAFSQPR